MWAQIGNWLYQNAMAIFISAIRSVYKELHADHETGC